MGDGPTAIFVYGTLMPGRLRWPMLEPHATGVRAASVPGRLFDTGHGWPAARFDGPGGGRPTTTIPGWVVNLRPDRLPKLLDELDVMEGVPDGRYRRIVVDADGTDAWTYETLLALDRLRPIAAWVDQAEN